MATPVSFDTMLDVWMGNLCIHCSHVRITKDNQMTFTTLTGQREVHDLSTITKVIAKIMTGNAVIHYQEVYSSDIEED